MQIKEAAERLGIAQRMLRHYENSGLMDARRSDNGYRSYSEADLRCAGRIRDLIATGFSTREVRAMTACLSDEGAGPCVGGIPQLKAGAYRPATRRSRCTSGGGPKPHRHVPGVVCLLKSGPARW